MPTAFADALGRLGASTVTRLADDTLVVGSTSIDGVRDSNDGQPVVAGIAVQSQRTAFTFLTDDLAGETLAEDTAVTLGGADFVVAVRTDIEELGQTRLELRKA